MEKKDILLFLLVAALQVGGLWSIDSGWCVLGGIVDLVGTVGGVIAARFGSEFTRLFEKVTVEDEVEGRSGHDLVEEIEEEVEV